MTSQASTKGKTVRMRRLKIKTIKSVKYLASIPTALVAAATTYSPTTRIGRTV